MKEKRGSEGHEGASIFRSIKGAFLSLILIFFLTVVGFVWVVNDIQNISKQNVDLIKDNKTHVDLIKNNEIHILENKRLIANIQAGRVVSCLEIYEGIRKR